MKSTDHGPLLLFVSEYTCANYFESSSGISDETGKNVWQERQDTHFFRRYYDDDDDLIHCFCLPFSKYNIKLNNKEHINVLGIIKMYKQ